MSTSYDAVILADGLFPRKKAVQRWIAESRLVVCCDGAAKKLMSFGRIPDVVIGDLDSLSPALKRRLEGKWVHIPDQSTNDLTKAIQWTMDQGLTNILIVGATGLREDHTLANIALLHQYTEWGIQATMISDFGTFIPTTQSRRFSSFRGQQVSLFSLTPDCPISSEGLKYPLDGLALKLWWMGTLNESLGDSFSLQLHTEGKLIVYQVFG